MPVRESPALMIVGRLSVTALGLASIPIIAHGLGPAGRGQTAAALAAFFLVPILVCVGLPYEVRRRVAADGEFSAVRTGRVLAALTVVPSALVAAVLTTTVLGALPADAALAAFVGVTAAPFAVSWMNDTAVLASRRRFGAVAIMQLAQPLVFVIALLGVWMLGALSVAAVLWCNLAGSLATFVLGLVLNRVGPAGAYAPWRALLRGSLTFYGGVIADTAYRRMDQVIMLPILGAHESGLYSVAVTIGGLPIFIAMAFAASVFPDAAGASAEARQHLARSVISAAAALGLLAAVGLAIAAPFVVLVLFGPAFTGAFAAVYVAIAASVLVTVNLTCSELLAAANRGLRLTLAQSAALVSMVSLLLLLGPGLGALGAAIGALCAAGVALALLLAALHCPPTVLLPRPRDLAWGLRRLVRGRSADVPAEASAVV
ncbi:oligosaccharide flippase family protein [Rathayibacter sp. YIM 133350]|uniref:oligosaccharide flippase family protein n=1 Tax=Rathayibacter sp. YIM 133350 TaxID=3131992 RepID=UPI00307CE3C3